MALSKPIAVLISDVHYSLNTMDLADKAVKMAISKANELIVPLIVAGDLHDTKANLRGECVAAMTDTFNTCGMTPYVLVGNHDKINEKSSPHEHSLRFLEKIANIVETPTDLNGWTLIPYCSNPEDAYLSIGYNNCIMHQGLSTANMGEYIQDKTALDINAPRLSLGGRIISGHYHARQTIDLPNGGKWDYIGNPYTVSFGEANDPRKGFQVLWSDGSLQFIPTNLRQHIIVSVEGGNIIDSTSPGIGKDDVVWVKAFDNMNRKDVAELLGIDSFKLTYEKQENRAVRISKGLNQHEILDKIIDGLSTSDEAKARIKSAWKSLCE